MTNLALFSLCLGVPDVVKPCVFPQRLPICKDMDCSDYEELDCPASTRVRGNYTLEDGSECAGCLECPEDEDYEYEGDEEEGREGGEGGGDEGSEGGCRGNVLNEEGGEMCTPSGTQS